MESNTKEDELINYSKIKQKKVTEIVDALNSLILIILDGRYQKLEINQSYYLNIHELIALTLDFIEKFENDDDDKFDSIIAIAVFRVLFMDKFNFKINDWDKKIESFSLLLKAFQKDTSIENSNEFEEMRQYELFENIAKEYNCNYYYSYCLYLIFKYSESNALFFDIFISLKKISFKIENDSDLEITKHESITDEELQKISPDNLLSNLNDIYNTNINFFVLEIDQRQIKIRQMSPEEMQEKLQTEEPEVKKKKKKKKKNKKIINSTTTEHNSGNKTFEARKIPEENMSQKQEESKEENKEKDKNESQEGKENKEDNNPRNESAGTKNRNYISLNKTEEDFKTTNSKINDKEEYMQDQSSLLNGLLLTINELKEKINKLEKEKEDLKGTMKKEKEDLKGTIDGMKKEKEDLKGTIIGMKKDIAKYEKSKEKALSEILILKQGSKILQKELKFIKLRDVFKNIIDIFSIAYNIGPELSYNEKTLEIKKRIPLKKGKEEEWRLFNKFFSEIYSDFQAANKNAHSIDIDLSIIDQVFDQIDPFGEMKIVKERLMKGNVDRILKKLGYNRMNNFENKSKFQIEERKILDNIKGINDIYPSI